MIQANLDAFDKYTSAETLKKIIDYNCVTEMWENCVKQYSDNIAVQTSEIKLSFTELDSLVSKYRTVLSQNGIKVGDRVGIYIPNSVDFVKSYLAVTTLGAVAVLLPPHLDSNSIFGLSMMFGLSAIIYADLLSENTSVTASQNPAVKLLSASLTSNEYTPSVTVESSAPCTVIFTGGTTGKSKGSLLSHRAVMTGTKNGCYGYKDVFIQRYLLVLPLTHVFGLIRNMLTSLYTGSALFICANNKDMFRDIAVFKPTIIVLVPALAEMALNLSKKFGKNMLGNDLNTIICGAAFVPPYLIEEYKNMGISLLPGYGLTESANLVSGNPNAVEKPDSVGCLYPEIQAKIVDSELWLKGPNMQEHYMGDPKENDIVYEDGWFKTGDLARFDEDGFLYITGRKKEIIVLPSGENVSPAELEAEFSKIDAISDCLVYANDLGSLELEVLIRESAVKENNIENPQEHIKNQVSIINETLPSFEKITRVVFRETDFVRSPSMKIVRSKNGNVKN